MIYFVLLRLDCVMTNMSASINPVLPAIFILTFLDALAEEVK